MAADTAHIIDLLQAALLRDLGEEVELIFRYGSLLKGTAHQYSDLDISYVPVHESTWHSITVLVDGMLIDLYPIHWSRLEQMAAFEDVSATVLLHYAIIYQRSEEAAARLHGLTAQLCALQQPDARPAMLRKAQTIFQRTGYPYYLLREQAAAGHLVACWQQGQQIAHSVLHCLAVCNQAFVDTRKPAQVLALPKLPIDLAATLARLTAAATPGEVVAACDTLLRTTRDLLLAEQRQVLRRDTTFPAVFGQGYPELKADLQHALLACEQHDLFALKRSLLSFYHEVSVHLAQALMGVEFTGFNSLADYEQVIGALGFPELWPAVATGDFAEVQRALAAFDRRLQEVLTTNGVALNAFGGVTELQAYLDRTKD
jgi:hypothetical protein